MEESEIRILLDGERAAALESARAIAIDFDEVVASSVDSNSDDEHDPEGSTVAFERAQLAASLAEIRTSLDAIDQAFVRLANGRYGECERCGAPIAPERLAALPTARCCIGCAVLRPSRP
jgi:DnaK suppressor protein